MNRVSPIDFGPLLDEIRNSLVRVTLRESFANDRYAFHIMLCNHFLKIEVDRSLMMDPELAKKVLDQIDEGYRFEVHTNQTP